LSPFSRLQSLNQTRWKQTIYTKNVGKDLTFAMMINKVEVCLGEGSKGTKTMGFEFFCASSRFSDNWYPRPLPRLQKRCSLFGCLTPSHQLSSQNIDRKFLFVK